MAHFYLNCTDNQVSTTYTKELVEPGEKIYIDDGYLSFTVIERLDNGIRCRIDNSGLLGENKVPDFKIASLSRTHFL